MVFSRSLRVFDILQEINRRRTIPAFYREILEERLIITFKPLGVQKRGKTPRSKEEYRVKYKEKKAQKVYLEILEDYPHIFIPFILAITPKGCERFNVTEFRQNHGLTEKIDLGDHVRATLESIARKRMFSQNPLFQLLIESVFPPQGLSEFSCQLSSAC